VVGRALVGRLVGFRVYAVRLGRGRQIASFRVEGTLVQVRAMPIGGIVVAVPLSRRFLRLRVAIFVLGGAATYVVVAITVLITVHDRSLRADLAIVSAAWLYARAASAIGGKRDGKDVMLRDVFNADAMADWGAATAFVEALYEASTGHRDEAMRSARLGLALQPRLGLAWPLGLVLVANLLGSGQAPEAIAWLRSLLKQGSFADAAGIVARLAISMPAMMRDGLEPGDARSFLDLAVSTFPDEAAMRWSRSNAERVLDGDDAGGVIVELGSHAAIEHRQALILSARALGRFEEGDVEEAMSALRLAESLNVECELLELARTTLAATTSAELSGSATDVTPTSSPGS
jgi:hypothetical protein